MRRRNLILTDGGMGDLICELVAVDYLINRNTDIKIEVWVPDNILSFARHVVPKAKIFPFSYAGNRFKEGTPGRTTQWFEHGHTPMRIHPVDYGFHMLADRHIYDINHKNYLQIRPNEIDISAFDLPEKYVCIVATAAEECKAMPKATLNGIAAYISKLGYTPVFLGREKALCGYKDFAVKATVIDADYSVGLNLINQTETLEAAGIIAGAKAIVGMDSGLIHVAGFTDTWIIAGYSLVDPIHVAPIRNGSQTYRFEKVEPDEHPAKYIQTRDCFYEGDYRYYPGLDSVISSMTPDKFIEKLVKIL